MANYIINNSAVFDDIDGSLYILGDESNPKKIPNAAVRLLKIFVDNTGEVLSKEHIINEVWVKYGFSNSGNNLYHYTSLLRKELSQHGVEDSIITVPKVGFKFLPKQLIVNDIELPPDAIKSEFTKKIDRWKIQKKFYIIIQIFIIVTIVISLYFFTFGLDRYNRHLKPIIGINKCNLYSLSLKTRLLNNDALIEDIYQYGIDCSKRMQLFYSKSKGYSLMYSCYVDEKYTFKKSCNNYIVDSEVSL
ncbi:hypothetical protein RF11_03733 [Thelohanellus kitauei]|uniref:OmpR/PhoB-type domain-containing protein n=1 Tax=Thelohanellus kitauei TaxID=669202 RepID=A0A0C2MLV0_THEKT|nr:hypothetical protein RF11_03733 [Thelohanellus kitauei]